MEICLFEPDIAGNVGSIMRTAAFFGIAKLHIIMPTGFLFDAKELKRSKMDYGGDLDIIKYDNFADFNVKNYNRKVLLTTKTDQLYYNFTFKKDDIIIAGNESRGVSGEVRNAVVDQVKIPGQSRSLNLAVSVGIITSVACRA